MNLDPIEQKLRLYSPSTPPTALRDEILDGVAGRIARRRRTGILAIIYGLLLASGVLTQVLATSTYERTIVMANGDSRPVPRQVMAAYAATMGIRVPDAGGAPRKNGG
jgi:hypothetical protein